MWGWMVALFRALGWGTKRAMDPHELREVEPAPNASAGQGCVGHTHNDDGTISFASSGLRIGEGQVLMANGEPLGGAKIVASARLNADGEIVESVSHDGTTRITDARIVNRTAERNRPPIVGGVKPTPWRPGVDRPRREDDKRRPRLNDDDGLAESGAVILSAADLVPDTADCSGDWTATSPVVVPDVPPAITPEPGPFHYTPPSSPPPSAPEPVQSPPYSPPPPPAPEPPPVYHAPAPSPAPSYSAPDPSPAPSYSAPDTSSSPSPSPSPDPSY